MKNLFFLEAKCVNTNKNFYIRFDKAAGGVWCQTYGVKNKPVDSTGDSFQTTKIDLSNSVLGPQYKCPYCGNTGAVRCGACGKWTCKPSNTKEFTCAHCGNSGIVNGTVKYEEGNSGMGQ